MLFEIGENVDVVDEHIHVITFAAGSSGYRSTMKRLTDECSASGYFQTVKGHDDSSLQRDYPDFYFRLMSFVQQHPRGFGLWVWKPFLVMKTLESLPEDALLLYLDAGCSINASQLSIKRWNEYLGLVRRTNVLAFQLDGVGFSEKAWNRKDLVDLIGLDKNDLETNQIEPGVVFYKNTRETREFVKEWFRLCTQDDYRFLKDPDSLEQFPEFREHRWDQSIFSVLYKKRGYPLIKCETFFEPNWFEDGKEFPIWATRLRGPVPTKFSSRLINILMKTQRRIRDLL